MIKNMTKEEIEKDIATDERIIGIFRTIHSKIIQMKIDIKNFITYDGVIKDKVLLEKFYQAMKKIYETIHSELTSFKGAVATKGQEKIFFEILKNLEDLENKISEYSKYLADIEQSFKEPIDQKRFENDYEILNTIYNRIRTDEDIAEKYMKILEKNI